MQLRGLRPLIISRKVSLVGCECRLTFRVAQRQLNLANSMHKIHLIQRCLLAAALMGWLAMNSATAADANQTPVATRQSPDWLRSSVVYEIFPRSFSKEGNLNAITARLDELKDLGVNVLWLMPIHPIGEKMKKGAVGSPFAVRDFYAINPDYGTSDDFKRLVEEAHKRGLKVVMDIVAGQTSWDSVLMEHPDFYLKNTSGAIVSPDPAWADVAGLNYANPAVRAYISA